MRVSLLPHADVITPATHVRSTLLQASLNGVRTNGYFQRWEAFVDPLHRDTILEAIAPSWLPIEVGLAHYLACDRFGLDQTALERVGTGVGAQLQSTLLKVAAQIARNVGTTPEVTAQCIGKLWPRLCQGGSLQMTQVGPKETLLELRSAVLSKSSYFRGTLLGNVRAASRLFGHKLVQMRTLPYDEEADRFTVHVVYG